MPGSSKQYAIQLTVVAVCLIMAPHYSISTDNNEYSAAGVGICPPGSALVVASLNYEE